MTSVLPSESLKRFLGEASEEYHRNLMDPDLGADAARYLMNRRKISADSARYFRLGVVGNPLPGHEQYTGKLAIPYLTRGGVLDIRFRCITCEGDKCDGHAKYQGLPGSKLRVFHPEALLRPGNVICITEGEIDCITAVQAGLPCVGFPGVASLKPYTPRMFVGYSKVFVLADNDDSGQGMEFADKLADLIENVRIIQMPDKHDVNSFVREHGPEALKERLDL